jgi:hypothetical protein
MLITKKDIYLFSIFFLLSLILFYPSFSLALFGDDWLTLWRYFTNLGANASSQWNHLSYFFTSYGPQDILMGLLHKVYGYNSGYYYLTSYLLRTLAALSLFPLLYYLTKNKLATFFSIGFFLITPIGIETTNWVFNMPSYIAIIFLNIFLYYFFISRLHPNKLVIAGIFFFLTIISQPIRMHGLLPTILALELFWILQNRKQTILKLVAFRSLIFTLIFIPAVISLEKSPVATVSSILTYSSSFKLNYILNPFITLGATIIPSDIISSISQPGSYLLLFITGIFVIIISVLLLKHFYHQYLMATAISLSLALLIFSFILAWWREPYAVFLTTHRYLIISAVGSSVLFGLLIHILKGIKSQIVWFSILIFFAIHAYSTWNYLNLAQNSHSQKISQKIWASIPYITQLGENSEPVVFFFLGDGTNEAILHDVITFGFPPHMGLIYNTFNEDKLPIPISNPHELVSAVVDGKSISAYNRSEGAVPVEKVYAFQLLGRNNLVNITEATRKQLLELKK